MRPPYRLATVLVGVLLCSTPARAFIDQAKIQELVEQAKLLEQQADWDKACDLYEAVLRVSRSGPIQERYLHCLRRAWQVRRHQDSSYRKDVLAQDYGQALRLYATVFETLLEYSLDKNKVTPALLFAKGLEEFAFALADPVFLQLNLPMVQAAEVEEFRQLLKKGWGSARLNTRAQVLKQIREVALSAQAALKLNTTVTVLEFVCGACYAVDDYTFYLTPGELRDLSDSLQGELVGVGLTLEGRDGKTIISEVAAFSSATEVMPPLQAGDLVLSIDRKALDMVPADAAQRLLTGPADSIVELGIFSPSLGMRTVVLRRRAMILASAFSQMLADGLGYLHIAAFHELTVQEVDAALAELERAGMKGLLLDLRGNSGGLFDSAIEVARRFLASGTIASLQDSKSTMVYQARNPAALGVPLVVLVDGDTASAAEVLAGALKDSKRGRLVGQPTFGKGCTQSLCKLPSAPGGLATGGLRITVARFFSPAGIAYSGRGVVPHLLVDSMTMPSMAESDHQFDEARLELLRVLAMK